MNKRELLRLGLGDGFFPGAENILSEDILGLGRIFGGENQAPEIMEPDSKWKEESSEDISLESGEEKNRKDSQGERMEVDSDIEQEKIPAEEIKKKQKREYHLEILGKDEYGQDIYKLSDMYIPEDPLLKKRILKYARERLLNENINLSKKKAMKLQLMQRMKEQYLKISNYYENNKAKVFDEKDIWLDNTKFHQYKRNHPSYDLHSSCLEEEEDSIRTESASQNDFSQDHKETDNTVESVPQEIILLSNWEKDVLENLEHSVARKQAEAGKISEKRKKSSEKIHEEFQDFDPDLDIFRPQNLSIEDIMKLEKPQPKPIVKSLHWGQIEDEESQDAPENEVPRIEQNYDTIAIIEGSDKISQQENEEEKKIKSIYNFSPINQEVIQGNWVRAVLFRPFDESDESAKEQFRKYLTELPLPHEFSRLQTEDENLDFGHKGAWLCRHTLLSETQTVTTETTIRESQSHASIPRWKITQPKIQRIVHSKVAYKCIFNKLYWDPSSLEHFHRNPLRQSHNNNKNKAPRNNRKKQIPSPETWPIRIIKETIQKEEEIDLLKNEYINAHEYFNTRMKLSLQQGKFCLLEHADQHPLYVNNFGMASKLIRFAYDSAPISAQAHHLGPYGIPVSLGASGKVPLLGQVDPQQFKGITIVENNMYRAPVFFQPISRGLFILVKHNTLETNVKSNFIYTLRNVKEMFTIGQEEPKMEIYNPVARQHLLYLKDRAQKYVYKVLKLRKNMSTLMELTDLFPEFTETVFIKHLKDFQVEKDPAHNCYRLNQGEKMQFKDLPEKICRVEASNAAQQRLRRNGIKMLLNTERLGYAVKKYLEEESNPLKRQIAQFIENELICTPWNLTQNFLHSIQNNGMMKLVGAGDPSHGLGGYNFLKKPQKLSVNEILQENVDINSKKGRRGNGAERNIKRIKKKMLVKILLKLGYQKEEINGMKRSKILHLLQNYSKTAMLQGKDGQKPAYLNLLEDIKKKEYERLVNTVFKKQMELLSSQKAPTQLANAPRELLKLPLVPPKVETLKIFQNSSQEIKTPRKYQRVEFDYKPSVTSLQDIPGLSHNINSITNKFEILKKTIKIIDKSRNEEKYKTVFISDPKQIQSFKERRFKRQERKKGSSKKKDSFSKSESSDCESYFKEPAPSQTETEKRTNCEENEHEMIDLSKIMAEQSIEMQESTNLRKMSIRARKLEKLEKLDKLEKQFNSKLEEIADSCIALEKDKLFIQSFPSNESSEYIKTISNPLNFTIIKDKAHHNKYNNLQEFLQDIQSIHSKSKVSRIQSLIEKSEYLEQFALKIVCNCQEELMEIENEIRKIKIPKQQ